MSENTKKIDDLIEISLMITLIKQNKDSVVISIAPEDGQSQDIVLKLGKPEIVTI